MTRTTGGADDVSPPHGAPDATMSHDPVGTPSTDREATTDSAGKPRPATLLLLVAGLVVLYFLGRELGGLIPQFSHWVEAQGAWGPVLFVVGYALATVALIPGSLLTLAAGAIFGLTKGTLVVFLGASSGACLAFLVSRYLARGAVERRLAHQPRFASLDRAVGNQGRKIVFLMRLSPVFPFSLLNYGLGLTRVRFVDYAIACFGMLPGTLLYVYYGHVAGNVAAAAAGSAAEKDLGYWAVLSLGLLATIAVTAVVTKTARRALREETQDGVD